MQDQHRVKTKEQSETLKILGDINKSTNEDNDSGIMVFDHVSCDPIYPDVLLYNRIFKTGSTSTWEYIKDATNGTNIKFILGKTNQEHWNKTQGRPYQKDIENFSRRTGKHKLVYIAHFFFRQELNINKPYTYINLFREPVARVVICEITN